MSELKQADKLKALGLKLPTAQANDYRDQFNEIENQKDYSTFVSDVNSLASFSEFETYLTDTIGLASEDAQRFRQRMEQKYDSFSDFQNALSGFSGYNDWIESFNWGDTVSGETTTDGNTPSSGFKFYAESGVTRNGVSVPAGSVEIFGPEVHFSQTGATADESTEPSSLFSYSGESVSDSTVGRAELVDMSVTIESNSDYRENFLPVLKVDGEVVNEGTLIKIPANGSRDVTLTTAFGREGTYDLQINQSASKTVEVQPITTGL